MLLNYFGFFALLVILPSFVFCGYRDQDVQVGQVPLKDTPVRPLNNVTIDLIDLSKGRGCRGKECLSHDYKGGSTYRRWGRGGRGRNDYDEDMQMGDRSDYDLGDACNRRPARGGNCGGRRRMRWYFSARDGICRRFKDSGCGGNSNSFRSRRRCEAECGGDGDEYGNDGGGYVD